MTTIEYWRVHDAIKAAWVRSRLLGVQLGPLERHHDRWRYLVDGDAFGGWGTEPAGADNASTPSPVR